MRREIAIHALKGFLEIGRDSRILTHGTSMEPFLKEGDLVQVEATSPAQLRIGDLIAFQRESGLVVHRFAGWAERSGVRKLRQQGDNLKGHGLVDPEALVGRVVWVDRAGQRRHLLHGPGLVRNRLHGTWVWGACIARESASWVKGRLRGVGAEGLQPTNQAQEAGPSREQELLILATWLALSEAQEARMNTLLVEGLQWSELLAQGAQFGLAPLLHHHLTRPALAKLVPEEARAALAKAYQRTSLKNLRMLGLLRRFLLEAREAGVEVILLKGAFLARWVYGDVGLRPMNDLDLLCRKADEPAIRKILEGMGGFRSKELNERELDTSHVRVSVEEKLIHSAPWWFPAICRIEVHYHLLSQAVVDDAWLLEALWAKAETFDWDGLPVRSLAPEHLLIYLTTHLHRHLEEKVFNLYWFADIREALRRYQHVLTLSDLVPEAKQLGLEEACARVARLLGEPWGENPGLDDLESKRAIAFLMGRAQSARGANSRERTVSRYIAMIRAVRHAHGLADKARYLRDLLFLPRWKMAREYGTTSRLLLPVLYLVHPFARLFQGLRGTIQHVQRRLGH